MCYTISLCPETLASHTHPHLALLWPLLELDTLLVESLDGSFEVVNSYANMSEAFSDIVISGSVSLKAVIFL